MRRKFISVDVYKFPLGECTNGGISSKGDITLVVETPDGNLSEGDISGPHSEELVLQKKFVGDREYLYFRPACIPANVWCMAGGNYAYTSDGRFSEKYSQYPIPIHDRVEE